MPGPLEGNIGGWYGRVEQRIDELIQVANAQAELLQLQSEQLEKLNTTYSETLTEKVTLTGARTIPQPPLNPEIYQTFELVALDVVYRADGTAGDRYVMLERFAPDNTGFDEFPQAYLATGRVFGSSWQNATITANQTRNMSWVKDGGNDGYTRVPIPQFPINVASGMRWRLRLGDYIGPDDICTAVYQLRVFKA